MLESSTCCRLVTANKTNSTLDWPVTSQPCAAYGGLGYNPALQRSVNCHIADVVVDPIGMDVISCTWAVFCQLHNPLHAHGMHELSMLHMAFESS